MTTRYLDVLTIRSNATTKVSASTNNSHSASHNLLYEPIILPNLQHLAVDKLDGEVAEDCMFYPTGESNRSMRRTMELAIRSCNPVKPYHANEMSLSIGRGDSDLLASKAIPLKPSSIMTKERMKPPRQPLFHVRGNDNNTQVLKEMLEKVRVNESKLEKVSRG